MLYMLLEVNINFAFIMTSSIPPLFRLPNVLHVVMLSEWLDTPSIGMLDTAMSSKKHRLQFLKNLQSMRSASVHNYIDDRNRVSAYDSSHEWVCVWWRWLSVRQIFIERILILGDLVQSDLPIMSIRNADINGCGDHGFLCLIRNCPFLRRVRLSLFGLQLVTATGLMELTNLHESLEEFFFFYRFNAICDPEGYHTQLATALNQIFSSCLRLHRVVLSGDTLRAVDMDEVLPCGHLFDELEFARESQSTDDGSCTSSIFTRNNLIRLSYYGRNDDELDLQVMTDIHQSCPMLEDLDLHGISCTEDEDFAETGSSVFRQLGRHCKHLRKLSFDRCIISDSAWSLRDIVGIESVKELSITTCIGVTETSIALFATMKLVKLTMELPRNFEWTVASLQSFVGSNASKTLAYLHVSYLHNAAPIDDVQVATALASCHNLKALHVFLGCDACVFGVDAVQMVAVGCALLEVTSLCLTIDSVHCLGANCAMLKRCHVMVCCVRATLEDRTPMLKADYPLLLEELESLYPAVWWRHQPVQGRHIA